MKRILLILFLFCFTLTSFSQKNNKNVNVRIESERVGDSVFYKKITTTVIGNRKNVKEEIIYSELKPEQLNYNKQNSNSLFSNQTSKRRKVQAFIIGLNMDFSILNYNERLNSLLDMNGIDKLNVGGDFSLGGRLRNGMEFKFIYGVESIINRTSNKKLSSISNIGLLTLGYDYRIKDDKYIIVPYSGVGYNLTNLLYSQTYDREISFEELKESSWAVLSHNWFIPLGVEFRYRLLPISYLSLGVEYRFNIYNSGAMLPNTFQKVYDFPKFTINNLAIKIGLTGVFNK